MQSFVSFYFSKHCKTYQFFKKLSQLGEEKMFILKYEVIDLIIFIANYKKALTNFE